MSTRALYPVPSNLTPEEISARMDILGRGRMVKQVYLEAAPNGHRKDGTPVQYRIVVEYHGRAADFKPTSSLADMGIDVVR